jgi:hypothetical protein
MDAPPATGATAMRCLGSLSLDSEPKQEVGFLAEAESRVRDVVAASRTRRVGRAVGFGGGLSFASDQGWPLPTAFNAAPAFLALAIVGPVAKWIDLGRGGRTRGPAPSRATPATSP